MVEIVRDGALPQNAMLKLCSRFVSLGLLFALLITFSNKTIGAELTVQIRSPNNGAQITQEQDYLLVSGKVALGTNRSPLCRHFCRFGPVEQHGSVLRG